mgnify:CR=1 FL=1
MPKLHLDKRADLLREVGLKEGSPDDLLDTRAVATWLRCSSQLLEILRSRGGGPAFIRLSPSRIRYRRQAVMEWLAEREYANTKAYKERRSKKV